MSTPAKWKSSQQLYQSSVQSDMSLSFRLHRKPFITFPLSTISISWSEKTFVCESVTAYLFAELVYAKLRKTIRELW